MATRQKLVILLEGYPKDVMNTLLEMGHEVDTLPMAGEGPSRYDVILSPKARSLFSSETLPYEKQLDVMLKGIKRAKYGTKSKS